MVKMSFQVSLVDLPYEILCAICKYLSLKDKCRLAQVSVAAKTFVYSPAHWDSLDLASYSGFITFDVLLHLFTNCCKESLKTLDVSYSTLPPNCIQLLTSKATSVTHFAYNHKTPARYNFFDTYFKSLATVDNASLQRLIGTLSPSLLSLSLAGHALEAATFDAISKCSSIKSLDLRRSGISNEQLQSLIQRCGTTLNSLSLFDIELSDLTILCFVQHARCLKQLNLGGCKTHNVRLGRLLRGLQQLEDVSLISITSSRADVLLESLVDADSQPEITEGGSSQRASIKKLTLHAHTDIFNAQTTAQPVAVRTPCPGDRKSRESRVGYTLDISDSAMLHFVRSNRTLTHLSLLSATALTDEGFANSLLCLRHHLRHLDLDFCLQLGSHTLYAILQLDNLVALELRKLAIDNWSCFSSVSESQGGVVLSRLERVVLGYINDLTFDKLSHIFSQRPKLSRFDLIRVPLEENELALLAQTFPHVSISSGAQL
jgi:hypothetical protein